MKRKVGPLPLLGGLQTQPAEGKPNGLLRCLNMEVRDGLLSTRRGQVELPAVFLRREALSACAVFPADPSVGTTLHIGCPASALNGKEDTIVTIDLSMGSNEPFIDTTYTFEYFGEDSAWHTMSVHNASPRLDGVWAVSLGGATLEFVVPNGWYTVQPPGLPSVQKWMRITKSSNWISTSYLATVAPETASLSHALIAPTTRTASGPFALFKTLDSSLARQVYDVIDVTVKGAIFNKWSAGTGYLNTLNSVVGTSHPFDGLPCWLLYIPDTDTILVHAGGTYSQIDPAKSPGDVDSAAVFAPDIDERYADIGCETSLPRSRAAIIFGRRIFLLGAGAPSRVQWSAPGAFWTTWPSANVADVAGGAGGEIMGGATDNRQLYIFTTSSIWIGVLGDPTAGNESDFFLDLAEETPCVASKSIVVTSSGVLFLSDDGVRVFDGRKTKLIGAGVRDLFRPDSDHPLACLRKSTAVGAFHPIENQYWLSYASPAANHNDTTLVYDLDDGTVHLWGADPITGISTPGGGTSASPIGQRARGVRAATLAWSEKLKAMVCSTPGVFFTQLAVGVDDLDDKIRWYFESHNIRIAATQRAVLEDVAITVLREHFQNIAVSVIPDGDRSRIDTRNVPVQVDRLNTASAIGSASLAGQAALNLDASIAPVRARFRKAARNHRLRVEGVAPNHTPTRVFSITADISVDDEDR